MKHPIIPFLAFLLASCGGGSGVSGIYESEEHGVVLELKSNGTAIADHGDGEIASGRYRVEGDKVLFQWDNGNADGAKIEGDVLVTSGVRLEKRGGMRLEERGGSGVPGTYKSEEHGITLELKPNGTITMEDHAGIIALRGRYRVEDDELLIQWDGGDGQWMGDDGEGGNVRIKRNAIVLGDVLLKKQ